jgi:hypothetical protein
MEANAAPARRVLTWRRLLVAAAVGLVVLSLGQALVRGDREALALVVIIVVGLVLLRRGTGTLGAVFLILVFGDFLVWTMWAAMNNLRHGEEPEDVTLPAVLAILSLSGLVACWAALARRRQPQARGPAVALKGSAIPARGSVGEHDVEMIDRRGAAQSASRSPWSAIPTGPTGSGGCTPCRLECLQGRPAFVRRLDLKDAR